MFSCLLWTMTRDLGLWGQKLQLILDYNVTKGAIDAADQCISTYEYSRRPHRWPLKLFFFWLTWPAWMLSSSGLKLILIGRKYKCHLYLTDLFKKICSTSSARYHPGQLSEGRNAADWHRGLTWKTPAQGRCWPRPLPLLSNTKGSQTQIWALRQFYVPENILLCNWFA